MTAKKDVSGLYLLIWKKYNETDELLEGEVHSSIGQITDCRTCMPALVKFHLGTGHCFLATHITTVGFHIVVNQ